MFRIALRIAYAVVTVAALAAAVLSFNALMDLVAHNGVAPARLAFLFPVVVDFTGVGAMVSILALKAAQITEGRWFPWMVLVISVSISLAANGIHAAAYGSTAIILAMVPPLMLLLSTELCVRLLDTVRRAELTQQARAASPAPVRQLIPVPAENQTAESEVPDLGASFRAARRAG
ncbi:MAG: DUF2637 domain-containing protein [Rhodococcus sp. (in: high G+C Gram-positive bacteria)]